MKPEVINYIVQTYLYFCAFRKVSLIKERCFMNKTALYLKLEEGKLFKCNYVT